MTHVLFCFPLFQKSKHYLNLHMKLPIDMVLLAATWHFLFWWGWCWKQCVP
jgi:hypothetical protein